MNRQRRTTRPGGFTLVELLVVIFIIALISAVTLPTVIPMLNHRQVSESARILQAALVGIRDAAIRANAPRGLRLLPDPALTVPSLDNATVTASGTTTAGTVTLAYNRFVPIEAAPDYSEGQAFISLPPTNNANFPTPYFHNPSQVYPCFNPYVGITPMANVLLVEEAIYYNNVLPAAGGTYNSPTAWFWNIRVGDKIRFGDSGNYYTVVGPLNVNPLNPATPGQNPELFVNVGPPGTTSPLLDAVSNSLPVDFLYLVNGQDDNGNGYVDEGFDGVDNNGNGVVDEYTLLTGLNLNTVDPTTTPSYGSEWEVEKWLGTQGTTLQAYAQASFAATLQGSTQPPLPLPTSYTITRRPVVSPGAREVALTQDVVIDATTWNLTHERSRLPIDPTTLYVDVLLNPSGELVPTTVYSNPGAFQIGQNFLQFWLAERQDVHAPTDLWGTAANANSGMSFLLPMPAEAYTTPPVLFAPSSYPPLSPVPSLSLQGDRHLITLFSRNGTVTSHTIENFNIYNVNTPYYESQDAMQEDRQ